MKGVEAAQFLGEGGLTCGELAGSEETPSGAPLSRDSQEGTVVCPRFPRITRSGWYPRLARPLAATPGTPPAEFSIICGSCLGRAGSCPRRCLRTSTKTNLSSEVVPTAIPLQPHTGEHRSMRQKVLHAPPLSKHFSPVPCSYLPLPASFAIYSDVPPLNQQSLTGVLMTNYYSL